MNPDELNRLEFKKSTSELKSGMETLCGFLNGGSGRVFFGVTPGGKINGQDATDPTLREIAEVIRRIDPPIPHNLDLARGPGRKRFATKSIRNWHIPRFGKTLGFFEVLD